MVVRTTTISTDSVLNLRARLQESLPDYAATLLNIIDSLASESHIIGSPSDVAGSPLFGYALSTLYTALSEAVRGSLSKAERKTLKKLLKRVRRARMAWFQEWGAKLGVPRPELGVWQVRVLDATDYPRPKAPTVERGYAHGVGGMRPGHTLSVLSVPGARGAWMLPLEIELVPVGEAPSAFGSRQIVDFIAANGWDTDELLVIDAGYTNAPTLKPILAAHGAILGRISGHRVLFQPPPLPAQPPAKNPRGRPPKRGAKMQLWDENTLPKPDLEEKVELDDKRTFEISRYDDVRMRQWPEQRITLYRVTEYRADGTPRYKRPLWLIYVGEPPPPTPAEAQAIYGVRFGIEHSFRFLKSQMGLVSGEFNGQGALDRVALWVEMVGTAFWELFALRGAAAPELAQESQSASPAHVTPGAVRKAALGIFVKIGITRPSPLSRGKSPGRAKGTRLEPRKRHKVYRKGKPKPAA